MITFSAKMLNVNTNEWIAGSGKRYSIAQYTKNYTSYENPFVGHERSTITSIPLTDFSGDGSTNIGWAFEHYAKEIFKNESYWPTLRLCTTDSSDDYYLEWRHGYPTALSIKAGVQHFTWDSCLQWSNEIAESGDPAQYHSYIFVTASTAGELINSPQLQFGGAYRIEGTSSVSTLVCDSRATLMCGSKWVLIDAADTLLCVLSRFYQGSTYTYEARKQYNGPAWCALFQDSSGYRAIGLWVDSYQSGSVTNFLAPGNGSMIEASKAKEFVNTHAGTRMCISIRHIAYLNLKLESTIIPIAYTASTRMSASDMINAVFDEEPYSFEYFAKSLYTYLTPPTPPSPVPPSDVDPDNPPDPDEPPEPIPPDDQDPYYDPTSDPDSPEYDPTKDPDSPEYDPTDPDTPYRPPSTEGGGDPPVKPPEDPVTPPPTPPSHAINSRFVTLYTPSLSQLNALAEYLWSPAWSIDGFKKIFANPMDCILGLMIFPALAAPSGSKEVNVGNLSTGVTMSYIDNQYVEVNCGSFEITEYYASYLDYDPYTKIEIYLPYIGTHRLSADDVMAKTIQLKYMIDLLSGACVAFLVVDGTTLYTFTGSCATPIPVSGNDWSNMVNGILSVAGAATAAVISGGTAGTMAAGALASTSLFVSSHKEHIRHGGSVASAAGLMSIQTPYLIVTRPRQALPIGQNSFQGYPSFMTESLGSLSGYTEVESCHLEHIPCTDEELKEIERLLKGGVLF